MDWFSRTPGGAPTRREGDTMMTLIGDQIPDAVRLPRSLGGRQVAVIGVTRRCCEVCGGAHVLMLLDAEHEGRPLGVLERECLHAFHWLALAGGEE